LHSGDQCGVLTEWPPKVLSCASVKLMLIHKQDVVFEARIKMWLEAQVTNDRVVVTVDVGVDSVKAFEELAQGGRKMFRKWDTDAGRECCFVVDV
jgi:hypothetical protein